jgi:hypothetical protein
MRKTEANFRGCKNTTISSQTLADVLQELKDSEQSEVVEEFVFLSDLAKVFHIDRSNIRKYVKRMGIQTCKRKSKDTGYQLALAISKEDAARVVRSREEQGLISVEVGLTEPAVGVFYIVQLVPDLAKKRIKVGFTGNLDKCLQHYRITSPTAVVLKSWQCKRMWKQAVIDGLVSAKYRVFSREVFECDSIKKLLRRGDAFFALLPKIVIDDKGSEA